MDEQALAHRRPLGHKLCEAEDRTLVPLRCAGARARLESIRNSSRFAFHKECIFCRTFPKNLVILKTKLAFF